MISTPSRRAARYTVCTTAAASPPGDRPTTTATGVASDQPSAAARLAMTSGLLAAQQRVDEQRLQPGVPQAAGLGRPGVDPGRRERDLAGEPHHRLAQHRLLARLGQVRHLLLDHVDRDLDQLDGVLQVDRPGQRPRRGVEDLVGDLLRLALGQAVLPAQPLDQRPHAGLRDQRHPGPLVGRHLAEPRQHLVHPGHARGRQRAGGPLDPGQRRGQRAGDRPGHRAGGRHQTTTEATHQRLSWNVIVISNRCSVDASAGT